MTTPGFFELYKDARPALPAGAYTATSSQDLVAATLHDGNQTIPVDDTAFHLHIDAPRYVLPPDQILSTFPPATSRGDWRERLPQIVLKRRTLPWERNPTNPPVSPDQAPPWLALVVLADGEGKLSPDVDVATCVSDGVTLSADADVPKGKYLEVTKDIVEKVFPCLDELDLLCHVRKVDLRDTELALGDDDGFLAVVMANRLPQPAPPQGEDPDPVPLNYTAYLINLEHQLDKLLPTEPPDPPLFFNTLEVTALVNAEFLQPAPNVTLDQLAMQLGAAAPVLAKGKGKGKAKAGPKALQAAQSTELVRYDTAKGLQTQGTAWATGPAAARTVITSSDLAVASEYRAGISAGVLALNPTYRFPVLVSWDFTCTGSGGFERLMNDLQVGLLGTLDDTQPQPRPEVAPTGHVALSHRTRRGEPARSWFRGPLTPQPTQRAAPVLSHTGDQLRKVTPDGREDVSLAALFEIGRLLTLNKPTLVAALMNWRRDLFGAARARELADKLSAELFAGLGVGVAGGRDSLEDLVRHHIVGSFTALGAEPLAPSAREVTTARVPDELKDLTAEQVLVGLGADPKVTLRVGKQFGVDGLGAVPVPVAKTPERPVSRDDRSMGALTDQLLQRVDELVLNSLKIEQPPTDHKGASPKSGGAKPKRSRRKDALDRLIDEAAARAATEQGGDG
jgi:hypothetical protein